MGEHTGYVDGILFADAGRTDDGVKSIHPINVRVCRQCGSLVGLEDEHDVWHEALARTRLALQALATPIGGGPF